MRTTVLVGGVGKALEAVTLVLLFTLVPRLLGPSDYGSFAVALSLVTLASAASALGGPTWLSRFVPTVPVADRPGLARALAVRSARWRIGVCGVAAFLATILALVDPDRFDPLSCFLVVLAITLDVAATLVYQVGLALGRIGLWSLRYPIQNAVLVAGVLVLHAGFGIEGAFAGIALSSGAALLVGLAVVPPWRGQASATALPPGAVRFAVIYGASGFFVQLLHRGGVVLVAVLAGSQVEAGFAAVSIGIALGLTYLVWQWFALELPRLAAGGETRQRAEASVRSLAWFALWVTVPAAIVAAVAFDQVITRLAGERFGGVEASLGPALAIVPLAPLTSAAAQLAALRLQPLLRLLAAALGAAVFLGAAFILVPGEAALGATIALLLGSAAAAAVGAATFGDLLERRFVAASFLGTLLVLAAARWS